MGPPIGSLHTPNHARGAHTHRNPPIDRPHPPKRPSGFWPPFQASIPIKKQLCVFQWGITNTNPTHQKWISVNRPKIAPDAAHISPSPPAKPKRPKPTPTPPKTPFRVRPNSRRSNSQNSFLDSPGPTRGPFVPKIGKGARHGGFGTLSKFGVPRPVNSRQRGRILQKTFLPVYNYGLYSPQSSPTMRNRGEKLA